MTRSVEKLDATIKLIGPINVTGPGRVRIIDLAHQIMSLSKKDIQLTLIPDKTQIWGQVVDCSKARELLGWSPKIDLQTGLSLFYKRIEAQLQEDTMTVPATD